MRAMRVLAAHGLGDDRVDGASSSSSCSGRRSSEEGADLLELAAGSRRATSCPSRSATVRMRCSSGANSRCSRAEPLADVGRRRDSPDLLARRASARRALRIDGDVDRLLHHGSGDRRQQAERAEEHGAERQPHAGHDALHRDPSATGCAMAIASRDPVEPVDDQHHVGRLRRGGRASRAHRHADVGRGERRRVVHAVAHHDRRRPPRARPRPPRPSPPDRARDRTRSTPSAAPTDSATSGWSPVTITTRSMPARRSVRITRGESGRIGSSMTSAPATVAVDGDEHAGRAVERGAPAHVAGARAAAALRRETNDALPSATRRPSTLPSIPAPCCSTTSVGNVSARPRSRARAHDRRRQHVRRDLVERGREPQQLVGARASPNASTSATCGTPDVSVPVLSNSSTLPRAERLERAAALDDDAAPGGARDARDDRDRHREDQRARRRHHQDGERADGVAGEQPRRRRRSPASRG